MNILATSTLLLGLAGEVEGLTDTNQAEQIIRRLMADLDKEELLTALVMLTRRFTLATQSAKEHFKLLAINEFKMSPHQAEDLNLPTMVGSLLGVQLAGLDQDKCCSTCAFRENAAANHCAPTIMEVHHAFHNNTPFMCHHNLVDGEPVHLCRGFAQLIRTTAKKEFHEFMCDDSSSKS